VGPGPDRLAGALRLNRSDLVQDLAPFALLRGNYITATGATEMAALRALAELLEAHHTSRRYGQASLLSGPGSGPGALISSVDVMAAH